VGAVIGILVVWTAITAGLGVWLIVVAYQRDPAAPDGPRKVSTGRIVAGVVLIIVWAIGMLFAYGLGVYASALARDH
jgi:hypothetical protein